MKTLRQFSVFLLTTLLFTGCFDDDGYSLDKYWIDIATVENPEGNASFFFVLDDSTRMWTAASSYYNYRPDDGQRIIANYTILWDKRQTGLYDYDVKLNDAYEVLTKGIFTVSPATQDSIGDDSIQVSDIWIGSKYLNVEFLYQGFEKVHFINLVNDPSKSYTDGKIHLEFRHNSNQDAALYNRWGVVSFDISSLQTNTADSVQLVIHVNEPNRIPDKLYELTYHYKTTAAPVKRAFLKKPFPGERVAAKIK